jgi:ribosomal protein S18 acetylase RimI-like enzyme
MPAVIQYRSFRNDDPPRLADVWRSADLGPGAVQPMTTNLLEAAVFSKPYFDRAGLVVAVEEDRVVGFAHAAFGPNKEGSALDHGLGTTLLVAVVPHSAREGIAAGLIERTERYLVDRGARVLLGGGSDHLRGFYLGLYGGSDLPGILDSSTQMRDSFLAAGYRVDQRIAVLRRTLTGYRPAVDRVHLAIRRSTRLCAIDEPSRRTWWEAATTTGIALRRYELRGDDDRVLATASFWDMQPQAASWGVAAAGLLRVEVCGARRREGLARYLLGEAMHDLACEGVSLVETQVTERDFPAIRLFARLGFEVAEHGSLFRKPAAVG